MRSTTTSSPRWSQPEARRAELAPSRARVTHDTVRHEPIGLRTHVLDQRLRRLQQIAPQAPVTAEANEEHPRGIDTRVGARADVGMLDHQLDIAATQVGFARRLVVTALKPFERRTASVRCLEAPSGS